MNQEPVKARGLVNHTPFALLALFVVASAFARSEAPEVTFVSPCECQGFHGKTRWVTKTDQAPVPSDKSVVQPITPSQIYGWEGLGPDVDLTRYTGERMPSEQKWYALTGRVVDAKVEADGDIHIALVDANGNNVGTVSAEIPVGPKWCEIRQTVFSWMTQKFPFGVKTAHTLKIREPHVITVTGKAFYDIGHAPADHSNRRSKTEGYADSVRDRCAINVPPLQLGEEVVRVHSTRLERSAGRGSIPTLIRVT